MEMNITKWLALGASALVVIGCVSFPDVQNAREVQLTQLTHVAAYGIDPQLPVNKNDMVREYPVDKIAAHTYVIHGPLGYFSVANQGFMNNPAFVVTAESVVVIDPGSSLQAGRMVMKQLRKVTNKPVTHVLNTHIHPDHWLGNQAVLEVYPNAVLMAHPEMIKRAPGVAQEWVSLVQTLTNGFTAGTRAVIPTVAIGDRAELKTGGMTFRIHAPRDAHSNTDIMIQALEDSVVFGGDNLMSKRLPRLDDATFKGSIEACRVAASLNARHYVPGHGPTGDVRIVKAYETYLTSLYAEVKKHYDAGKSDFEMKDAVVAKLKPYADWANFKDVVGKHISLAILEIERTSF
jgi:glyoxylase-like metal-dependent hydrolase (beta-lactamase superfamily II)